MMMTTMMMEKKRKMGFLFFDSFFGKWIRNAILTTMLRIFWMSDGAFVFDSCRKECDETI